MSAPDEEPQLHRLDTSGASGYLHRGSWTLEVVERHEAVLRPVAEAQAEGRALLRAWLAEVPVDAAGDTILLACELISNAVRHASGPPDRVIQLHLARGGGVLRVEVCDGGAPFEPQLREAGEDGGFGLLLIDRIAARWGVALDQPSCIWFEVPDGVGAAGSSAAPAPPAA